MLTKADLLNLKPTIETVTTDAGDACVGVMSGANRDAFVHACSVRTKAGVMDISGLKAQLVALTLCDENGHRLFEGDEAVDEINAISGVVIDQLFEAAQRVNGLTEEVQDDLEGN